MNDGLGEVEGVKETAWVAVLLSFQSSLKAQEAAWLALHTSPVGVSKCTTNSFAKEALDTWTGSRSGHYDRRCYFVHLDLFSDFTLDDKQADHTSLAGSKSGRMINKIIMRPDFAFHYR